MYSHTKLNNCFSIVAQLAPVNFFWYIIWIRSTPTQESSLFSSLFKPPDLNMETSSHLFQVNNFENSTQKNTNHFNYVKWAVRNHDSNHIFSSFDSRKRFFLLVQKRAFNNNILWYFCLNCFTSIANSMASNLCNNYTCARESRIGLSIRGRIIRFSFPFVIERWSSIDCLI